MLTRKPTRQEEALMAAGGTAQDQQGFIPFAEGRAFVVEAGRTARIRQPEDGGGQVGDMNVWNQQDPREHFWGSRTALFSTAHISTGDQLYSTWPGERPIMTVVEDSIARRRSERGALQHDVVMGRCSQKLREWRYKQATPGCQELLAAAIEPFGLGPEHVHDALNLFMATALGEDDRFFFDESDARPGEFIDLKAEIDCLVAISACPGACTAPGSTGLEWEILG
jgi:uncharacterized protein YcgI (DUF1989 family)